MPHRGKYKINEKEIPEARSNDVMGGVQVKMADIIFGCCVPGEHQVQRNHSRAIDRELAKERIQFRRTIKILLLGSGESGKSTFVKQMRIIHGKDFKEDDLLGYKRVIYSNIVKGMKVLIDARDKLNIAWQHQENVNYANHVFSVENSVKFDDSLFLQFVPSVRELWKDSSIQSAFERRTEFQLVDSIKYFLDSLDRISEQNYIPSRMDILHARKATKGISEHEFIINRVPFRFVDVGGQRSQRQKWYQCFEGVTSILFLVASSEFDQGLVEDRCTNRLEESCNIFETIVNNKAFSDVSIILFLNKTDLLAKKVRSVSIADFFPSFVGDPHKLAEVQNFELQLFNGRRRTKAKPLFHHFTTAIDTENIRFVFDAVRDTILQDNLRSLMLQ